MSHWSLACLKLLKAVFVFVVSKRNILLNITLNSHSMNYFTSFKTEEYPTLQGIQKEKLKSWFTQTIGLKIFVYLSSVFSQFLLYW
jgi:hypothetical protein